MSDSEDRWAHEFSWRSFHHALPESSTVTRDETKPSAVQNRHTAGINPTSFHRKRRSDNEISSAEKVIDDLLLQASKNEMVLKRQNYTKMQKVRLEAFEEVTSFRIFPLQSLAMEFLDEMMKDYLGVALQSCQSRSEPNTEMAEEQDTEQQRDSGSCRNYLPCCTTSPSHSPSDKRRKIDNYTDMNKLREGFIKDYIREMMYNPLKSNPSVDHFLPPLWSMEPRIFALETASSGKRKYIVGNLGRFLDHYWRKSDPLNRHYYELIRENTPCRLYFDLEYCKISNAHISNTESEILMTEFIKELCSQFLMVYNIMLTRSCVVDLDSSTSKKFSRHLIVHLPSGELFADALSAGSFAKQFVSRLADELASGILVERHSTLARYLFVNSKPGKAEETALMRDGCDSKNPTKMTCFVDLGVYTRNRLFRLLGSSKFGNPASAALRIAEANEFQFSQEFDNSNFYISTLMKMTPSVPLGSSDHDQFCRSLQWDRHALALSQTFVVPANASKINYSILSPCAKTFNGMNADPLVLESRTKPTSSNIIANRPPSTSVKLSGESPMPKLDKYILSTLGQRGGAQGRIRAWSIEQLNSGVFYMTYQMCENRWCERIGRPHKSNNIMWTVDLKHKTCWQSCHDSECRGFRGCELKLANLSDDAIAEIDEFIFDRELEQLDEKQVVSEANVGQCMKGCEFDDTEFDEVLQNLEFP